MEKRRRRQRQKEPEWVTFDSSDDEKSKQGPNLVPVTSTHYELLPSGNLSARTHIVNVLWDQEHSDNRNQDEQEYPQDLCHENDHHASTGDEDEPPLTQSGKKRRIENPLHDWLKDRDYFLSEFLRHEGRDDEHLLCAGCQDSSGLFRCIDCDGMDMLCRECILLCHQRLGLHRLEEWDLQKKFFVKTTLRALGYIYRLGHPNGVACQAPSTSHNGLFTVLDINGIHTVTLEFCGCENAQPHFVQLLRFRWFPATVQFPRTAVMFRLLKFYQILSFESKTTGFEFFSTLSRITENTGTVRVLDRYSTLLRVVREYRHVKMLKRGSRGHDPLGALGTKPGQCAVLCPACPQWQKNMCVGWENAPPDKQFLHTRFLGLDANFRLKRRLISSNANDPSLSQGWSYFVEENMFKNFLNDFGKLIIQEPSSCSNHDAVNRKRATEGYGATGVGTCDCIRHDVKQPISVGDSQKGERYVNMDYVFLSCLKNSNLHAATVSYDIACQWSIKLWERNDIYPESLKIDKEDQHRFRFLVPKFHLPAHILPCQTNFSFNFNKHIGRTDGEGVERGWSAINPIATSTREMGPGSRRDTLDDHFGDWNWKKTIKMAQTLRSRFEEAVPNAFEHSINHLEFTEGLKSPDVVAAWSQQLAAWEDNHTAPNPFVRSFKGLTLDQVRRELAEKESKELNSAVAFVAHESISASQLITMGMDLEIQQNRMALDSKKLASKASVTEAQKANLILQANTLRRKITNWIEVQELYIPALRIHRQRTAEISANEREPAAYSIPLYLPSSLPVTVACDTRLFDIEFQLRYAQCTDSLDNLRDALCLRSFVLIDKARFQRGQRANTRSQGIVDRVQGKVEAATANYQRARNALARLSARLGKSGWERHLLVLRPEDVRALSNEDTIRSRQAKKKGKDASQRLDSSEIVSEGHRLVSWIWRESGGEIEVDGDNRLHESLRIEWCKSKARADCWMEEVELLQEEHRRVLAFFEHRASEWEVLDQSSALANEVTPDNSWMLPNVPFDPTAIAGQHAYARRQAHQFRMMRDHCVQVWQNVNDYIANNDDGVNIDPLQVARHVVEDDETVPIPPM